jgi:diguanylate cyclase (GGDEF)-like protein/PAS domain S-box-containing protein
MMYPDSKYTIQKAQLDQLFAASKLAMVTGALLSTILAVIQFEVVNPLVVNIWLSGIYAITLFRMFWVFQYERGKPRTNSALEMRKWLFRFRLGVILIGVAWGASSFLFFTETDLHHQMFLVFMLAGLSAGGIVSMSVDLFCAATFVLLICVPLALRLFLSGGSLPFAMGMAVCLYMAYMVMSSRQFNKTLTDNIVLRQEAINRQDALRLGEERFRLLLNHSPVGIFHYDTSLNVTYCNECFADIMKTSAESVVGCNLNDLMSKTICVSLERALAGEPNRVEGRYAAAPDDSELWIGMTCSPSRDSRNRIVGGIAIVRDITENRQKEEMRRISEIAFETQTAMLVTTPGFAILRVNEAFSRLSGYSVRELMGKTPELFLSGRHDKSFFKSILASLKKNGNWQGEVWSRRKNNLVDPEWVSISAVTSPEGKTSHYVMAFSDVAKNKDAMAEIHRLAYYDPLTHLPNRRLLRDRLNQELANAAESGSYGAILFLDLDSFKALNDARGHDAGDQLLIQVANRLRDEVRDRDIVGRLGGDEFVVIQDNLSHFADEAARLSQKMGEKLLRVIAEPFDIDGYEFYCSTSIGIRLFREQETVEELLRHADLAMYQAKADGRNTFRFFDPAMQTVVTARADMEKDIRIALEQNQFELFFQSQEFPNRKIIGAEVLLRWRHPKRGLIHPLEFIQLAEKNNLIVPIGHWVIAAACEQLKRWESSIETRCLQLSVNVSARQFRQPDFVEQVRQTMAVHAIKPDLLKFELTESLVLDKITDTITKMQQLREVGVRFSLDDFGTGYSSLSYLSRLPLDQLKIDQSFVRNIGIDSRDSVIVQTIIGMARNLGLDVIAEGVEHEFQRVFLTRLGCPAYQGYLFSKPMPIAQFEVLLRARG